MTMPVTELIRDIQLSTLPEVYYRLNEAINNPNYGIRDIADIISDDPALCARLLRIANSSMFRFPSSIDTISQAITIVGTQQLRDLTLACSIGNLFPGIPPDLVNMNMFWRHSISTGICARTIATLRRENNVERFYVSGLLHDIGRLAIYISNPAMAFEALKASRERGLLLFKTEDEYLHHNHAEVSAALLESWQLPTSISEPVRYHHRPEAASLYPEYTAVLHLADIIARSLRHGSSGETLVPPLSPTAWDRIGLELDRLPIIIATVEQQYEDAVSLFLGDDAA